MLLHLVRHGRPVVVPGEPAAAWPLDPSYADDVRALRDQVPEDAVWFSSPEPKALATAQLLTDSDVTTVEDLREQVRPAGEWLPREQWLAVVRRTFAEPNVPTMPGWEPLAHCRARVASAVRRVVAAAGGRPVALAGHATAWTALAAELTGAEPDVEAWRRWAMPDLLVVRMSLPGGDGGDGMLDR